MTSRSGAAEKIEVEIPEPVPAGTSEPESSSRSVASVHRAKTVPLAGTLTIIVPVERMDALRDELKQLDEEIKATDGAISLRQIQGLHVARWMLLPARVRGFGRITEPTLVMWTVFDGERYDHVYDLVAASRALLDRIYRHCVGYPGPDAGARDIENYLLLHRAKGRVAAYNGTPGRSTKIIQLQEELATELATFVRAKKSEGLENKYVFLEAQRFVDMTLADKRADLARFARERFRLRKDSLVFDIAAEVLRTILGWGTRGAIPFIAFVLLLESCAVFFGSKLAERFTLSTLGESAVIAALLLLVPAAFLALSVVIWTLFLRRVEALEALHWVPVPDREFQRHHEFLKLRDNELSGMNRMTIVTDVKPGIFRRITCHTVLGAIALRARRNHDGVLDGVETIHFAEWRFIDGGKRLLFMSNYDGDALSYFQAFSDNASPGINAIWGNTEGFPPTQNFIGGGARNLEEFQNAARVHQIPTDVWYYSYPSRHYQTCRINDNWRIHAWLNAAQTPSQVDEWITTLEGRAGLKS